MLKYAAKRLGMGLVTLFVLATATFFLMKAIPGSPFGAEVSQMSAAAVEKLYEKYDLDKSIPEQYVIYIKNVLHNDFGESMTRKGISVNSIIAKALRSPPNWAGWPLSSPWSPALCWASSPRCPSDNGCKTR